MKERARTLESIAARKGATFNLTEGGEPERVLGAHVTASYFPLLRVAPALGRVFTEAEDAPGAAKVAVLSHRLFIRRFGGDPAVVGRGVLLSGVAHIVVGVMPESFAIPEDETEIWTPIAFGPERSFDAHYLGILARLKEGVSEAQLGDDMRAITVAAREAAPRDNEGRTFIVANLLDRIVGDHGQRLLLLLGAVSLVFLVACVNVASLLLARGAARTREIAVRAALGAGRFRIARQLLTEALVLSTLGAGVGILIAAMALPIFIAQSSPDVPRLADARLDPRTILIAAVATLLATLLSGLIPALRESRAGLSSTSAQASRGSSPRVRDRARQALVAVEVGLALMLLMGAALLIRSASNLDRVSPGFDPSNLLSARLALPASLYPGEERPAAAVAQIVAKLQAAPGVSEAAASTRPPLIGEVTYGLRIEGRGPESANRINARMQLVTPGYLETMRVSQKGRSGLYRPRPAKRTPSHDHQREPRPRRLAEREPRRQAIRMLRRNRRRARMEGGRRRGGRHPHPRSRFAESCGVLSSNGTGARAGVRLQRAIDHARGARGLRTSGDPDRVGSGCGASGGSDRTSL